MEQNHDRMSTMNISLPEHLRDFVQGRAAQRYGSVSEYIRELVREDERRLRLEQNEQALIKGLKDAKVDRAKVREAIDGLRRIRSELALGGSAMTRQEILAAVREVRR